MKSDVVQYVRECDIWQRNKNENVPYPGLLQPIPILNRPWKDVAMDFLEGLPLFENKDSILVVVDKFSKYAHFISLKHPYNAK